MKTLLLSQQEVIVSHFFGKMLLWSGWNVSKAKLEEFKPREFKSKEEVNSLEVRINNMTFRYFFNKENICYTCWIFFDQFDDEKNYIEFCNQYFISLGNNFWHAKGVTLEVVANEGCIVLT